jgi:hypothetical protein
MNRDDIDVDAVLAAAEYLREWGYEVTDVQMGLAIGLYLERATIVMDGGEP